VRTAAYEIIKRKGQRITRSDSSPRRCSSTCSAATGAMQVVEPEMSADERARLHSSAEVLRKALASI
jgi:hypothetical protein